MRIILNWVDDLILPANPPEPAAPTTAPDPASQVLGAVVRLVASVLRHHKPLLDEFNEGLRLIREQQRALPLARAR